MKAKAMQSSPALWNEHRDEARQGRGAWGALWLLSWTNELVLLVPSSESSHWQNHLGRKRGTAILGILRDFLKAQVVFEHRKLQMFSC